MHRITFLFGCMGLASVIALDRFFRRTDILAEGWPNSSPDYLIRSVVIFISIVAILWRLIRRNKQQFRLDKNKGVSSDLLSILATLFVSIVISFVFIFEPAAFSALSLEDEPIEWGSALLLLASSIITAISFSRSRNIFNFPKITQMSLAILSLVFFIIAMEEISWFQRVLEIETPEAFAKNIQYEMNLHNFATNFVENLYYFGAFIFLVLLPFFRFLFPCASDDYFLRVLVARPFIGIVGSVACAYNFDMWNIIFTQIAFFGSVVILIAFAMRSKVRKERNVILFTVFLILATQASFLLNGENFVRSWEVTEYKELFISLGVFVYALDVFAHTNRAYLSAKSL